MEAPFSYSGQTFLLGGFVGGAGVLGWNESVSHSGVLAKNEREEKMMHSSAPVLQGYQASSSA
jgi:hypothetical protein